MICIFCKKEIPQTGIDEITHTQAFKCPDCGFTFLGRKVFEKENISESEKLQKIKKSNMQFYKRTRIEEICKLFKYDEKKIIASIKAVIKRNKYETKER